MRDTEAVVIKSIIVTSMLGMLVTAAVGCAANIPDTRDARAAGYWQARLPTTPSTFGKLAYGSGGSAEPARVSEPASQPLMATATPAVVKHEQRHVRRPVVSAPTAVATQTELPVAKTKPAEPPVMLASKAEPNAERRYGEREAATKKLQDFRGGDAIVISAGALVIVLLIVILVLLLR
jgi:hypothetical protein